MTDNRCDSVGGAGLAFEHVAIDDHSCAGVVRIRPDEHKTSVVEPFKANLVDCQRWQLVPPEAVRQGLDECFGLWLGYALRAPLCACRLAFGDDPIVDHRDHARPSSRGMALSFNHPASGSDRLTTSTVMVAVPR